MTDGPSPEGESDPDGRTAGAAPSGEASASAASRPAGSPESAPDAADRGRWAVGFRRFALDRGAPAAADYTVSGRRLTGPQQGFGRLWRRTYTAVVDHPMPPTELLAAWRSRFGDFWPRGNRFYGSLIEPGVVAPISVDTRTGVQLATGVLVLYADDESFTFMTPEGHMFAGWITFSVLPAPASDPPRSMLQIEVLLRPGDPLYHLAWPVMRRMESVAWETTLRNVAREVCACEVTVVEHSEVIDRAVLWRNWRNVRYNAGIRSAWWGTVGRLTARRRAAANDPS